MNLKCGFDDGDDLSRIAYNLELMPITLNYFEYLLFLISALC